MHAHADHFDVDAGRAGIFLKDVAVDRTGIEMLVQRSGAVVFHGPEKSAFQRRAMFPDFQILRDQQLRRGMHGNEPDFVALAFDPKMHDARAALHIAHAQQAEFLAPDAVIEQGGQYGPVADDLQRIVRRSIEQAARLRVTKGRVLPSLPFALGRLTPSTGLPSTALRSHK